METVELTKTDTGWFLGIKNSEGGYGIPLTRDTLLHLKKITRHMSQKELFADMELLAKEELSLSLTDARHLVGHLTTGNRGEAFIALFEEGKVLIQRIR